MNDRGLLRVYFPNGSFHSLRYSRETSVHDIISTVIKGRICPQNVRFRACYSMRAVNVGGQSATKVWLPSHFSMDLVDKRLPDRNSWRFELRIRFFPRCLKTIKDTDKATFNYLHDQLKNDYIQNLAKSVDQTYAIRLGCLDIRRLSIHLNPKAFGKKINVDYIEKELGLASFFPDSLLQTTKGKTLRKSIKAQLKELEGLDEDTCILQYAENLKSVWKYDQEIYKCVFGNVQGALIIDPEGGLNFASRIDSKPRTTSKLSNFEDIEQLVLPDMDPNVLSIETNTAAAKMIFVFDSNNTASSVGYLIEGYCAMFSDSGKKQFIVAPKPQKTGDSGENRVKDSENKEIDDKKSEFVIKRNAIDIISVIGQGNFGEVYKGTYQDKGEVKTVAIKVGRENDSTATEQFLSEAGMMQKFSHPHIIRVFGVCPADPVMIVMELAEMGELRKYLRNNVRSLRSITLVGYCLQLASALEFLELNKFVHRDIATRNILMTSAECVKLADFGLSRHLDTTYYRASRGKLPFRWMAPESISFRRFTHASDVWMFGVCAWEIMTGGVKPFSGISNSRVIDHIDAGNRLPKPSECPDELYRLMQECWQYESVARPGFAVVKQRISEINDIMLGRDLKSGDISKLPSCSVSRTQKGESSTMPPRVSKPPAIIGIDFGLICDLHNKAKEIVGAVLSLNVVAADKPVRTTDIILQAKFVGMAVREFIHMIDIFVQNIDDHDKKKKIVESQEKIAEGMAQMIKDLRSSCVDSVVISSVKIAKISKTMFDSIQDQFFCSTPV